MPLLLDSSVGGLSGYLFFGWQLRHFHMAHDPFGQLPPDAPELPVLQKFESTFGSLELVIVALESEDPQNGVFSRPALEAISSLTRNFDEIEGVKSVLSLGNLATSEPGSGFEDSVALFLRLEEGQIDMSGYREQVLANPAWVGNIVSGDGSTAAINLFIENSPGNEAVHAEVARQIREILDQESSGPLAASLTGMSVIIVDVLDYMARDIRFFMRITPLFMVALLFFLFRRVDAVIVPLVLIIPSVIWVLGLFFLAGNSLRMVTTLLPTLISLIALSDVIHLLAHYYESSIQDKRERIVQTMEHMIRACFMTSVTTAAGIGSLASSSVPSIREFGIWSAIGIFIAYFLVVTLVPTILSLLPLPGRMSSSKARWHRWGNTIADVVTRRGRLRCLATGVSIIFAGFFMTKVQIAARFAGVLPPDAPPNRLLLSV